MKKKIVVLVSIVVCCHPVAYSQHDADFRKIFDAFKQETEGRFVNFRDSVNREYAGYLSQLWEEFDIQQPKPVPQQPLPGEDIRYKPSDKEEPVELRIEQVIPADADIYVPPAIGEGSRRRIEEGTHSLRLSYYGAPVEVSRFEGNQTTLTSVEEKKVADYWLRLSQTSNFELINELIGLRDELSLNDWALYLLIDQVGDAGFPSTAQNAKTVFKVFILNQMGYRAKIGRLGNSLVPLIAFQTEVYGKYHIRFSDGNYYVFENKPIQSTQLYSYQLNYEYAITSINLAIRKPFRLPLKTEIRECAYDGRSYKIEYNRNLVELYKTYPQTELQVYANSPISSLTRKSLEQSILPQLKEKDETEAVAFLLAFVQSAFPYQTDQEQFNYEKYFFVEELCYYPYSDCEDRAILFSQLVRRFVGLDVVLLDYTDHVSTAVKLPEQQDGDFVYVDNERYTVCDPTCRDAPIGYAMDRIRKQKGRVILLN